MTNRAVTMTRAMTNANVNGTPTDTAKGRTWVAIILAIGIATAVNLITAAVLYDAIASKGPGLSENATQVLTAAFGGIVGVLGAFVGYQAGRDTSAAEVQAHEAGRAQVTEELQAFHEGEVPPE